MWTNQRPVLPDGGPGQQPGDGAGDEEDGQGVGQDVQALIVPVAQRSHAPSNVQRGPVVGPHVLVKSGQKMFFFLIFFKDFLLLVTGDEQGLELC